MLIENGKVGSLNYYNSSLIVSRSRSLKLVFCLVGTIEIKIGLETLILNPKEFYLVKPMSTQKISIKEETKYLIIELNPLFLDKLDFDFINYDIDLSHKDIYYQDISKNIVKLLAIKDFNASFDATIIILEILNILKLNFKSDKYVDINDHLINQIIQYIDNNFQNPLSLEDLSELFNLTPQYISRLFKTEKHTTFLKYINGIRLERSLDPLIYSKHSILDIALEYGFPNSASYTKVFKEKFSCLPSEYRKQKRQNQIELMTPISPPTQEIERLIQNELNVNQYTIQYNQVESTIYTKLSTVYFSDFNQANDTDYKHVIKICNTLKINYLRISIENQNLFEDLESYLIQLENRLKLFMKVGFHIILDFSAISLLRHETIDSVNRLLKYFTNIISIDNIQKWRISFDFTNLDSELYLQAIHTLNTLYKSIHDYMINFQIMIVLELETLQYDIFLLIEESHKYIYVFCLESKTCFLEHTSNLHQLNKIKKKYKISKIQLREHLNKQNDNDILNDTVYGGLRFIQQYLSIYGLFDEIEIPQLFDLPTLERKMMSGQKGLVTWQGALKPLFYAVNFLKDMGPKYILHDKNCLVTTHMGRDYSILCQYAYEEVDVPNHINTYDDYEQHFISEDTKKYLFHFEGVTTGNYRIKIRYINNHSGNILEYWKKLSYTESLSGSEYEYLEKKSIPSMYLSDITITDGVYDLSLDLKKNELAYIHLIYKY